MAGTKKNTYSEPADNQYPQPSEKERYLLNLLSEIIVDYVMCGSELQMKLKESPKGFHLDEADGGPCKVCGDAVSGENSWYDIHGIKCISCQDAIDSKVIPAELVKDDYYTLIGLEQDFNVPATIAKKWIKQGILKARKIIGKGHKPNSVIFLRSDNVNFFPPKEMLRGYSIQFEPENEEPFCAFLEWYYFHDGLEYIKDYGIARYLK